MKDLEYRFAERYGIKPRIYRSPARINIIGEHTDYNGGWCLPMAVNRYIYLLIAPAEDQQHHFYYEQWERDFVFPASFEEGTIQHEHYLSAALELLKTRGIEVPAQNVYVSGNIPVGAGMSSSAALCTVFLFALNDCLQLNLSWIEIALMAQSIENDFMGVNCGLMDQTAVLCGKKDHVLYLQPSTQQMEIVPIPTGQYRFVLVNSMVKHTLADTAYNQRREECAAALALIQKEYNNIYTLSDLHPYDVAALQGLLPDELFKRAYFIATENMRVADTVNDLKAGSWESIGRRMFSSHQGLSQLYQVSCTQLDFLVERAEYIDGVLGARMMGGGFGGCTINLVANDAIEQFTQQIQKSYAQLFQQNAEVYVLDSCDGTGSVDSFEQ